MFYRSMLFAGVAAGSLAAASVVHAQTAAPLQADNSVQEVVVTALKRTDKVQNIPATVSVVSGQVLQKQMITSALDLPSVVPGLQIQSAPGGIPVALIHGLGSNAGVNAFDQSVSLFVDGVYAGHGRAYSSALFDVGDVEVIKGTQSALLGKNTSVGAVSLTTNKPGFTFGYDLSYSHEFELNSDIVDVAANLPLSDTLAIRVAGHFNRLGGWIHNTVTGQDSPETTTDAGRISIRWAPNDRLDWTTSYQQDRNDQEGPVFYMAKDGTGFERSLAAALGDPNFTVGLNDQTRQTGLNGAKDAYDVAHSRRVTSNLTYEWGDYQFTSLTGYYRSSKNSSFNGLGLPNNPLYLLDPESDEQISQEFRVVSPKIWRVSYIVGALYMHDIWSHDEEFVSLPPVPLTGDAYTYYTQYVNTESLFGQVNYDITDDFQLTGGLRYTNEDKRADFDRQVITPGLITELLYPGFASAERSRTEGDLDGSVGLRYKFGSGRMVYLTYSKGTKGGGYQNDPTSPASAEYKAEVAHSVELGTKLGFGSRGHVNIALFHTDVSNFQLGTYNGAAFLVDNIDLRSQGAEFEGSWRLTDALTAALSATYADVVNIHPDPAKFYGAAQPDAPKWSGSVSLAYSRPVTERFNFDANASVDFRSRMNLQVATNTPVTPAQAYAKVNLRLAVTDAKTGVEFALVGRNLNDVRVANFGYQAFPSVPQSYLVSTDPPRTIALQISIRR